MDKKFYLYIFIGLALTLQSVFANANFQYANSVSSAKINSGLQGYVLYVPTGTRVSTILSQEINSNTATVGQNVSVILTEDFTYKGQLVASSGSVISGYVVSNSKSAVGGKNAQMQIRFTTIRTPYNNMIPISAIIATSDSTGILKGSGTKDKTKEDVKKAADKGLGVKKTVAAKGEDIKIPSNSQITIVFEQPITLGAH